jgi:hypothetical protein
LLLAVQALLATGLLSAPAHGQRRAAQSTEVDAAPVYKDYRGIQIGMLADDVRKKLGTPKDKGDDQDFFVFDNEKETAQVVYDKAHKVVTVSVDFQTGASGIPVAKAVVGSDIPPESDGSMHLMVRYPKAGYWVSYSRTAGTDALISVTIQKMD